MLHVPTARRRPDARRRGVVAPLRQRFELRSMSCSPGLHAREAEDGDERIDHEASRRDEEAEPYGTLEAL